MAGDGDIEIELDIDGTWKNATIVGGIGGGCKRTITGTEIGASIQCQFWSGSPHYQSSDRFEVQLMSFSFAEDGRTWQNARYSNVAVAAPID
jgi:hypothetical protein